MKHLYVFLFLFGSLQVNAQSIRDEVIDIDLVFQDPAKLCSQLYLIEGNLDSLDLATLCHIQVAGDVMMKMVNDDKKLTYGALYDEMVAMKKEAGDDYFSNRDRFLRIMDFVQLEATTENWKHNRSTLYDMGFADHDFDYVDTAIIEFLDKELTFDIVIEELSKKRYRKKQPTKEELMVIFQELMASQGLLNYDWLMESEAYMGEPIVIYFNAFAGVNCRKFEEYVMKDPDVLQLLKRDCEFINVFVDDRTELAGQRTEEHKGRTYDITTVGQANLFDQLKYFDSQVQPFIVFLNREFEVLNTVTYATVKTPEEFYEIIDNAIIDCMDTPVVKEEK